MGHADYTVTLYSPQAEIVIDTINRDGIAFSRREYVARKYGESAPIFLAAYDWFVKEAARYLPKPPGAEYPYWAFMDPKNVDSSAGNRTLVLRVPADEAVFFDLYDWNKILCLQYIGENEKEERAFRRSLADYGIRRESDVVLTGFYPDLKRQVMDSWKRLFVHHAAITESIAGDGAGSAHVHDRPEPPFPESAVNGKAEVRSDFHSVLHSIQAGLWCIKKEWIL